MAAPRPRLAGALALLLAAAATAQVNMTVCPTATPTGDPYAVFNISAHAGSVTVVSFPSPVAEGTIPVCFDLRALNSTKAVRVTYVGPPQSAAPLPLVLRQPQPQPQKPWPYTLCPDKGTGVDVTLPPHTVCMDYLGFCGSELDADFGIHIALADDNSTAAPLIKASARRPARATPDAPLKRAHALAAASAPPQVCCNPPGVCKWD